MHTQKPRNAILSMAEFLLGVALLSLAAAPAARAQSRVPAIRLADALGAYALPAIPAPQSPVDLTGVIDIHAHCDPDSMPRAIDAIDLAKLAKARGMRGLVLKNHYESTAALAYVVRKEVPGIEVFGGIDLNLTVGGLNPAAVERMAMLKGGYGKVVWFPTFDNENAVKVDKSNRPFIVISKNGQLVPEAVAVIAMAKKYNLTLETGHSSATDGLLIVHEAHKQGVEHIVVTHAMANPVFMTIPQMKEAVADGALLEFVNNATRGVNKSVSMEQYVEAIRAIGPEHCILATDSGGLGGAPLHPDAMAAIMGAMLNAGFSQADVDMMAKTNPAHALGLQ
jgi:hypothetical protein